MPLLYFLQTIKATYNISFIKLQVHFVTATWFILIPIRIPYKLFEPNFIKMKK